MLNDKTEFEISQYLDGTLAPELRERLEATLAADPAARQFADGDKSLSRMFSRLPAVPEMDFDAFSKRVASVIASETMQSDYSPWRVRSLIGLAAAACLAMGLFVSNAGHRAASPVQVGSQTPAATEPAETPMVIVKGPSAQPSDSPAQVNVLVGRPANESGVAMGVRSELNRNTNIAIAPSASPAGR